ncbi:PREDICTED: odorant receptor 49b-like [Nicrophorus vespilloides]|uniref:Odorant receptor n=1 Tax=Nicrophorus vespilloides TaxID=110193 RepID=A0ABM1MHJ9_NICVS|nr:PREDICTED: odorant receptor 49b-like [Nicrophorus vespilloides]
MDEEEEYEFLQFHKILLKWLGLWPRGNELEHPTFLSKLRLITFPILFIPSSIPLVMDCIMMVGDEELTTIIQALIALVCIVGEHYMVICFLANRNGTVKLVSRVKDFQKFSDLEGMIKTDKTAILHAKILLFYSTVGVVMYVSMPLLSIQHCEDNKTRSMREWGIPCGLVSRVRQPFRFDYSPVYELMYLHQILLVSLVTWVIIMLTMLQCGVLSHAIHHLKKLRVLILELGTLDRSEMEKRALFCIRYHIEIIEFCDNFNTVFSSQMLMHISLTSFVISILGFQLLVVNTADFIRFTLHLHSTSSTGVGSDAYTTDWYKGSVRLQNDMRMIIMRSQKPVTLNAMKLSHMSLTTFLSHEFSLLVLHTFKQSKIC